MNIYFDKTLSVNYKSPSQKIRVLTEGWVNKYIFCPNCGSSDIVKYPNNQPVADFYCGYCGEDYELKSKKNSIGTKIVDGEYNQMIKRLNSNNNPNFFFLNYSMKDLSVLNFLIIPKHFFVPEIIEKRKPLSQNARRAGWTGCNISLTHIPESGKIYIIQNGISNKKGKVLEKWQKTIFLRKERKMLLRGWLLDIMRCIEKINKDEFKLDDLYSFEGELKKLHPSNNHIKDKIRQQLQILRNKGYIEFVARGYYRMV